MSKYLPINKVVESVSITHKFNKPSLLFLNTSDIEGGKIINKNYLPISALKGQAKKTIKKDDILFSEIRPKNRRFAYVDFDDTDDYVVSTKLMVLRNINPEVDNKYFYYFLTNDSMLNILQDRAENRICSFPQITFDLLSDYKIRVPEINEQQKIAAVLSALDAKIELNQRINAELEAMAKTLYDYWFVQFDFPFDFAQGKPDKNGKPYKTSGGKMVWNEALKREIPLGWEVKNLGSIENNIVTGKTPPTNNAEFYNGNVPFITIGDIRGNMHILETELKLSQAGADFQKNKYIPKGSICVSCIASPGLIGFATQDSQTNQQINSIVVQKEENRTYLYFALNDYFKFSKGAKTGNTFSNMNKGDFESINLVHPPEEFLLNFEKHTKSSIEQILTLSKESKTLTELRDWLLPMLMNGQVKVN